MATDGTERPAKRAKLLEDSDSDGEAGGVSLSINKEYAKRYEYNEKRKEKEKLEAKYGKGDIEDSETDSESETEDDEGELATEDLDAQITATLRAIRSKDPRVYDVNVKFYSDDEDEREEAAPTNGSPREKSMTLKEYHTKNLLEGKTEDDGEDDTPPRTYAQEQEDVRRDLVKQMHDAAGSKSEAEDEDEDDEDNFLIRKHKESKAASKEPKPQITHLDVIRAHQDPDTFLSNFLAARAWVPNQTSRFQPLESDDDEEEARAEAFEAAYNLRFEDPSTANEKLRTHARDVAAKQSVRRDDKSGRRKARDTERTKKEEEKAERQREKNQLRKLKIDEMEDKVKRIRKTAGLSGRGFKLEEWTDVLDADFNDDQWDAEMRNRFGESYYEADEAFVGSESEEEPSTKNMKKKAKKPKWDDDIDIKDLIPDFDDEELTKPEFEVSEEDIDPDAEVSAGASDSDAPKPKGMKKKDRLAARAEAKKAARRDRRVIESLVDQNLEVDFALPGASSTSSKQPTRFRYRETSPTTFGLTPRDILLASDTQLNSFAGLKKIATFRDAERKKKDRKHLSKKARLRQWRLETFGNEEGPKGGFETLVGEEDVHEERKGKGRGESKAGEDTNVNEGGKKRKRKQKKRKAEAVEA